MHHHEALVVDQAHRYGSLFAIVGPVIRTAEHPSSEDQGGIKQIDVTLGDKALPLGFVPFDLHAGHAIGWSR